MQTLTRLNPDDNVMFCLNNLQHPLHSLSPPQRIDYIQI